MNSFQTTVPLSLDEADRAIRSALADNGFGVITEIDLAATLKAKLDVDRPGLRILGACSPGFANRALEIDASVALLLPCNVVVEEVDGGTRVRAVDPRSFMDAPEFVAIADEAAAKLEAAVAALDRGAR
jgi:uncharacterized protein (DUF302 family)